MRKKIFILVVSFFVIVAAIVGTVLVLFGNHKVKQTTKETSTIEQENKDETVEDLSDEELKQLYRTLYSNRVESSTGVGIIEQKTIKGIKYSLSNDNNYVVKEVGGKKYKYVNGVWEEFKTNEITGTGTLTKAEVLSKLGDLSHEATVASKVEGKYNSQYNDFLHWFYSNYEDADFVEIRVYSVNNVNLVLVTSTTNDNKIFIGNGEYELTKLSFSEYKEIVLSLNIDENPKEVERELRPNY